MFAEVSDFWKDPETNEVYTSIYTPVWMWRQDYYNNFQCRMDWCENAFENANHQPIASINGDSIEKIHFIQASSGESVRLDASSSLDPDKDSLTFK